MKQGDFSTLAKDYINRPGYSLDVLRLLMKHVGASADRSFQIADVGAGTGKLTEILAAEGLHVTAIEPNDSMRSEGIRLSSHLPVKWLEGSGEATPLEHNSVNWVMMASSFHWVDTAKGLKEFHRILKPGGFFTALWNPRNIEANELHKTIEAKIHEMVPGISRVSSGSEKHVKNIESDLVSTGHFKDVIHVEASHEVRMTPERYLGAWRSVNDIQAQAGPERFAQILQMIETEVSSMDEIIVPYKTRSWTARRADI